MSNYELCFICDERTGRAGRHEDSLYDADGNGPYCDSCWDALTDFQKYGEDESEVKP
jgi:hypothetical protein